MERLPSDLDLDLDIQQFSLDIFAQLCKDPDNVFISPLSIFIALSMLMFGSDNETLKQLLSVLKVDSLERTSTFIKRISEIFMNVAPVSLSIANSVWVSTNNKFLDDYIKIAKEIFNADTLTIKTEGEVNKWVQGKTNGKISHIVDNVSGVQFLLVNAIYFKGPFWKKFNPSFTKPSPFYLKNGSQITIPFMHLSRNDWIYHETEAFQAVKLEYSFTQDRAPTFHSVVILPKNINFLDSMALDLSKYPKLYFKFHHKREGELILPKFRIEYFNKNLKAILMNMGLSLPFNEKADFSKLMDPKVFVDIILHKAILEVTEEGAEAAAVTVVMGRGGRPRASQSFVMKVDRPFLFSIVHTETGTLLFLGKIEKPETIK